MKSEYKEKLGGLLNVLFSLLSGIRARVTAEIIAETELILSHKPSFSILFSPFELSVFYCQHKPG